jgi:hypothetical protein
MAGVKQDKPQGPQGLVLAVMGALMVGARDDEIRNLAIDEDWGFDSDQITEAITNARATFSELLGVDSSTATGTALARLNHLLAKSLQIQDYKTAFSVQNEISKTLLTAPDVLLGPDKTPKNKNGRPFKDIDERIVYGMAVVGATNTEIAQVCGVSDVAILKRFGDVLDVARANLKRKLRRAQLAKAMEGNPTMLIWLGKQMLGQKDRTDVTSDDKPLATAVDIHLIDPPGGDGEA